jgi:hypothetical protein
METRKVCAEPALRRVGVFASAGLGIDDGLRRRFRAPAIQDGGRLIFFYCYINDAVTA